MSSSSDTPSRCCRGSTQPAARPPQHHPHTTSFSTRDVNTPIVKRPHNPCSQNSVSAHTPNSSMRSCSMLATKPSNGAIRDSPIPTALHGIRPLSFSLVPMCTLQVCAGVNRRQPRRPRTSHSPPSRMLSGNPKGTPLGIGRLAE